MGLSMGNLRKIHIFVGGGSFLIYEKTTGFAGAGDSFCTGVQRGIGKVVFVNWIFLLLTAVSFFYAHSRGVLPDGTQRIGEEGD